MQTEETRPLLDRLAKQLGCGYLSDLKYLDAPKRAALVRLLEQTPCDAASLQQWNDALAYLSDQPGAPDAAAARAGLIRGLRG